MYEPVRSKILVIIITITIKYRKMVLIYSTNIIIVLHASYQKDCSYGIGKNIPQISNCYTT